MSFPDIPSPEELITGGLHEADRQPRPAERILIVGYESVGRDLARILIRNGFKNKGLMDDFLGKGMMPGIDIVRPDQVAAESFDFTLRKVMPDMDVLDMFREERVLRTNERNLKALLKLSLEHKNQKPQKKGPDKHGRHSRWR